MEHLLLSSPDTWSNDERGRFFEAFIADILRPMRYTVVERLRFTGMEVDLLAKSDDQPRTLLVECKAQRDPLPAETISKLLGNVSLRRASAGWLFSVADLTKDGRAQWEIIQGDPELSERFTWFSPDRILDTLKRQRVVVDPLTLHGKLPSNVQLGNWTLIVRPGAFHWFVELVECGVPARYAVFNAKNGDAVDASIAHEVAGVDPRFQALEPLRLELAQMSLPRERAPVARVVSGDAWDDLRPASPTQFVGRDDIIDEIVSFVADVREDQTQTRTFAIQGPSGWGKSSLVLKLASLAGCGKLARCSVTAVDTRSATNSAFVSEALRLAFEDAASHGLIPAASDIVVSGLRDPLDSPAIQRSCSALRSRGATVVLIFDQFEELFAKEGLFETFNAVRELSLDLDARQLPVILGFAWKTDASLPQQHPAYHLWHQLNDRRRTFKIREFGKRDILKIVSKAEGASGQRLSPAVRGRVSEQSQNLPWLLKKLLVHVLQRVSGEESQYLFLERELDVELLFKEDLSVLSEEALRCLKYVAQRAPVAVADVEDNFERETTNLLIDLRLLVRSGMNYVVYWDVFRDYLIDGRVPHIPWARTFQRGPVMAVRALEALASMAPTSIPSVGATLGLKAGPSFNLFGDLVALQLVEPFGAGLYMPSRHLRDLKAATIAEFVQGQLRRHVLVKELAVRWEKEKPVDNLAWPEFVVSALPRSAGFSTATIHQYAGNLRNWLLFAGLLEQRDRYLVRPAGAGRQMGLISPVAVRTGTFLGTASPDRLEQLVRMLAMSPEGCRRADLERAAMRNALSDASTLELVEQDATSTVRLAVADLSPDEVVAETKRRVLASPAIRIAVDLLQAGAARPDQVGAAVAREIGARWKPTSVRRYGGGVLRYAQWAR